MKAEGFSLRVILLVPLLLLTGLAIGGAWPIYHFGASASVEKAAKQLQTELSTRISTHLQHFLSLPQRINAANASLLMDGLLPPENQRILERHFANQVQEFPEVSSIYFGNVEGGLANSGREHDGQDTYLIATDHFQAGPFTKFAMAEDRQRGDILLRLPGFDSRTRPWYTKAENTGKATWSDIYFLFKTELLAIAASRRVWAHVDLFLGVVAVDLFLSHIQAFLKNLHIGKNGHAFIMERSGPMIASSHHEKDIFYDENKVPQRVTAIHSLCPLTRAITRFVSDRTEGFRNIPEKGLYLDFTHDGERVYLSFTPLKDAFGIDWLICVILPEKDFMEEIEKARQTTFFFVCIIFFVTLLFTLTLTEKISRPILKLHEAAGHLAEGKEPEPFSLKKAPREIRELALAFLHMDTSLRRNMQDLTHEIRERKDAEEALRENARHTQAILDNALDAIITMDSFGNVASFNKAATKIFGYEANEVVHHNIKMLMPEPYHSEHDSYLARYRNTRIPKVIGIGREVSGKRKNGEIFPLELAVSVLERKNALFFIGILRDITERKRMESMKDAFVSTVSHELRTPLTSIRGALGLVTGGALGPMAEPVQRLLSIALNNTTKLTLLINDLLDMEKLIAGEMHFDIQTQPLLPLVRKSLEDNQSYGEKHGVSFVLRGAKEDIQVRIDSLRLQQVLANFLSNAAKFSPQGGKVEVFVEIEREERVRVSVKDEGPGIPEHFRSKIFEKFSQADASDERHKGGTGLGLAISREIVAHLGGEIGFESTEGMGATFYVSLPLEKKRTETPV